jgi:carboxymethylenebutenolidase
MGGAFALLCAPRNGFAAASVNYGLVPKDAENVLRGACPIVASYGAKDQMGTRIPERLQRALTRLEIPNDVKVYPSSGHRFMSEASGTGAALARFARMSYREADARDAWQRIHAFFGEYLSENGAT